MKPKLPTGMVRAISLHQPFASLAMIPGAKEHETRGWVRPYVPPQGGEWIALHASKLPFTTRNMPPGLVKVANVMLPPMWWSRTTLPYGALIGLIFIDRVVDAKPANAAHANDLHCGHWIPGRQAWHIAHRQRIEPVAMNGKQKWFYVNVDAVDISNGN